MLRYAYKGKRLQEKKEDATDSALQKMRRRYGVPYMQPAFFDLPAGLLLQQHYAGDRFNIVYDCFDLRKPIILSVKAPAGTILLLYPEEGTLTMQFQGRQSICGTQYYCTVFITENTAFNLLPSAGLSRFMFLEIKEKEIPERRLPAIFKRPQKVKRDVAALLQNTLQGREGDVFVTARVNDLLRHYFIVQRPHGIHIKAQHLQYITAYIQDHLDEPLTDKVLAGLYGASTSFFRKVFKAYTGFYPHRYVINARMQEAKSLLLFTALTVKEIAWAVGYADDAGLTHIFEEHFGQPPKQFRDNALKQNNHKRGSK